jgi:hypothetical protein
MALASVTAADAERLAADRRRHPAAWRFSALHRYCALRRLRGAAAPAGGGGSVALAVRAAAPWQPASSRGKRER